MPPAIVTLGCFQVTISKLILGRQGTSHHDDSRAPRQQDLHLEAPLLSGSLPRSCTSKSMPPSLSFALARRARTLLSLAFLAVSSVTCSLCLVLLSCRPQGFVTCCTLRLFALDFRGERDKRKREAQEEGETKTKGGSTVRNLIEKGFQFKTLMR